MDDNNNCGTFAQTLFSTWCNSIGINTYPSYNQDFNGWDFILEFNELYLDNIPIDRQNKKIEVKIQVKSTLDGKLKHFKISLKNLKSLIDYNYPVFFVLIFLIKEKDSFKEVKAVMYHLDEKIIERTLRKIRKLESEGKQNSLNKSELVFQFSKNDILIKMSGEEIRKRILNEIKNNIDNYIKWKTDTREKIGNTGYKGFFSINGEDQFKKIQDHLLGYNDNFEVQNVRIYDSRFNIDIKINEFEKALLKISTQSKKLEVIFKMDEFDTGIKLDWDYFSTYNSGLLPDEYQKYEIKYGFLKLYNENNKMQFSADFSQNNKFPFEIFYNSIKILYMLNNINKPHKNVIIEIKINNNIVKLKSESISTNFNDIENLYDDIELFSKLLNVFPFEKNEFKLCFNDIYILNEGLTYFKIFYNHNYSLRILLEKSPKIMNEKIELFIPVILTLKGFDFIIVLSYYIKIFSDNININNEKTELIIKNWKPELVNKKIKYRNDSDSEKIEMLPLLKELFDLKKTISPYSIFIPINKLYQDAWLKLIDKSNI